MLALVSSDLLKIFSSFCWFFIFCKCGVIEKLAVKPVKNGGYRDICLLKLKTFYAWLHNNCLPSSVARHSSPATPRPSFVVPHPAPVIIRQSPVSLFSAPFPRQGGIYRDSRILGHVNPHFSDFFHEAITDAIYQFSGHSIHRAIHDRPRVIFTRSSHIHDQPHYLIRKISCLGKTQLN